MKKGWGKQTFVIILILVTTFFVVYVRVAKINFESGDVHKWVGPWYDYHVQHGQINAFSDLFYNYTPAYLYLLSLVSLISWIPKLIGIKLISFIFDISAAVACYKIILNLTPKKELAIFGFFALLLLPTVFIESGVWGQCDIIYSSFLLWLLIALLENKNYHALIFFSVAIAFKLQAIFVAPIFVILFFSKKLKWYSLVLIPIIYFISILIPLIKGRPLIELLTIYLTQSDTYTALSMNAPNPYHILVRANFHDGRLAIIGIIFSLIVVVLYLIFRMSKTTKRENSFWIYDLSILSIVIPFILPKMHERYFFTGAIFLFLLAMMDRKLKIPAILMQVSSTLSYYNFLLNIPIDLTLIAFYLNVLIIGWVVIRYIQVGKNSPNIIN